MQKKKLNRKLAVCQQLEKIHRWTLSRNGVQVLQKSQKTISWPETEIKAEKAAFPVCWTKTTTDKLCQCMKIYLPNHPKVSFKMLYQSGKIWSRNNHFIYSFLFWVYDNALFSKIGSIKYCLFWFFLFVSYRFTNI